MNTYKTALTIAGSDPFGSAGIQADIKTFSACGCYAMSVITSVVDENSMGVYGIHLIPVDFVISQIKTIFNDVRPNVIKIGMLYDRNLIKSVADILSYYNYDNIVLDPVMVSTSGHKLLEDGAVDTLKENLIPLSRIITPNLPEAEIILDRKFDDNLDLKSVAFELSFDNKVSVFLKGGHLQSDYINDYFYDISNNKTIVFPSKRVNTLNTHGTGCSLSAAIASFLTYGFSSEEAVTKAKHYISDAIYHGSLYKIGNGNGPIHHFFKFWK